MLGLIQRSFVLIALEMKSLTTLIETREMDIQGTIFFDSLLYKCRFVVERTNAWLDAFKTILVRFETNEIHWKALNLLAFCVILLRQL